MLFNLVVSQSQDYTFLQTKTDLSEQKARTKTKTVKAEVNFSGQSIAQQIYYLSQLVVRFRGG